VTNPAGTIGLAILGSDILLDLELSALQQEGRGELISNPRLITSDQSEAVIKQGFEIPYQEASTAGNTSTSFKEAVLSLQVTPKITPDDRINMDLQVNQDNPDFARALNDIPPIDTRSITTTVLVDNGETVVLGGIYEQERSELEERVPFLGGIPLLGRLFKRTANDATQRELLIFVTPKIIKETLSLR
jgi:type IV pilus assembly protein PilQ